MIEESVTERPMYILIADIVESSGYSEYLDNKSWEIVRRDFSKTATRCILKATKCYKDYSKPKEGDTIIVYFMNKESAIGTALEIKSQWDNSKYNLNRESEGKPKILIAIAIHYGRITLTDEGPQGYIINLTSRLQKKSSELARKHGASKILATKNITENLDQESKIVRKIETFPLGKTELKDLKNMPEIWEIKLRSEVKGKIPATPKKVTKDEQLKQEYKEKGHPLKVLLQVIDVDILQNGNAFVTDTRSIKKTRENGKEEDEIYMGIYDSPDCKKEFTKELFSLKIKDGSGSDLQVKWHHWSGTVKRFGVYLGRAMIKDEMMTIRAEMFIPELFNLDADEEYFDLDIWDPTEKSIVRLRFPPGINIGRKTRFEYENGEPCPSPKIFKRKKDEIENRLIVTYVYEKPNVEKTYYLRWAWPKKKAKK